MSLREAIKKNTARKNLIAVTNTQYPTATRLVVVGVVLALWATLVTVRLVRYQVYEHENLTQRADDQVQRVVQTSPKRGTIIDRNGRELARSVEVSTIYVTPTQFVNPAEDANKLAQILNLDRDTVFQRLTSKKKFVCLKRKLEETEANAVRALNLPGIQFVTETKRFYPKNDLASSVLGFVNVEEQGSAGVEMQFDKHLRGTPGKFLIESDGKGRPFNHNEEVSEVGQSMTLTIDERIQYKTEQILRNAVAASGAKGGMAILLQPATGDILAMVSLPGFNPNVSPANEEEIQKTRRNKSVEEAYEPGSAFKIVTYSAALEEKLLTPDRQINCQGGSITIAGHTVRDGGGYGMLTVAEALQVSSNVAAIKTGKQLGKERLLKYVERFGFGHATEAGLPAESPGSIGGVNRWSEMSYASLPMGYEVTATPLQVVAAMSALANGGVWVQPHVVRQITSTTGDVLLDVQPQTRRVVSTQTATEMGKMLQGVVDRGTAKLARLSGYTAGGKTGTAKKFDRKIGRYSETKYFATFAGFAPINRPALAAIVVIDEPPFGQHHGGQAAAPVFKQIVEAALPLVGATPDAPFDAQRGNTELIAANEIPDEIDPFDLPALKTANPVGTVHGGKDKQPPVNPVNVSFSTTENHGTVVTMNLPGRGIAMPNLMGQGLRSAVTSCAKLGIKVQSSGFGVIREQSPTPGTPVPIGSTCLVKLGEE
ncbi:MAG: transpeptidase family protein [Blastocatellia bacterium]|nr:transpeptidase family protein [Blastocatellia bacterium]